MCSLVQTNKQIQTNIKKTITTALAFPTAHLCITRLSSYTLTKTTYCNREVDRIKQAYKNINNVILLTKLIFAFWIRHRFLGTQNTGTTKEKKKVTWTSSKFKLLEIKGIQIGKERGKTVPVG